MPSGSSRGRSPGRSLASSSFTNRRCVVLDHHRRGHLRRGIRAEQAHRIGRCSGDCREHPVDGVVVALRYCCRTPSAANSTPLASRDNRCAVGELPGADCRLIEGSIELAAGIEIIATPGHTPAQQSVTAKTAVGLEIIVAQAAHTAAEFDACRRASVVVREDTWSKREYEASLRRLHAMNPVRAYFSHDATVWQAEASSVARFDH